MSRRLLLSAIQLPGIVKGLHSFQVQECFLTASAYQLGHISFP